MKLYRYYLSTACILIVLLSLTLSACGDSASPVSASEPTTTGDTTTGVPVKVTITPAETASDDTITPTPLPKVAVVASGGFVINSSTIDASNSLIPQQYLDNARNLKILFNHQSVGYNVLEGLDALAQSNPDRYSLTTADVEQANWYLENNGVGGFTRGENENPASKVVGFKELFDNEGYADRVQVAMMKFCFVDNTSAASKIWENYRDGMNYLETKYPKVKFVWWTMPLITDGNQIRDQYNKLVRDYVKANNKILFDIADIESHEPSGKAVTNNNYPALFNNYSSDGGHLNEQGSQRVAQAWWWLTARLAGWNGITK
ncbi:MAG: SGNH/GDSL hydrolase family protein [Chloroflexi bacterium]|uniref:SGNH/GDSL hydrolase family protein n=1 Tax=Candidatus Chlorohelix allophototropha TaxID=3003348 RepID=A0A8T7M5N1_9CHLR|nr:SGNH/GDSL hydrolase family protein [Chloroflexota bacterium]WJW69352.1 hypothetical protein OZ401_002960 [Chloroflexota bacterium L227-S17]